MLKIARKLLSLPSLLEKFKKYRSQQYKFFDLLGSLYRFIKMNDTHSKLIFKTNSYRKYITTESLILAQDER